MPMEGSLGDGATTPIEVREPRHIWSVHSPKENRVEQSAEKCTCGCKAQLLELKHTTTVEIDVGNDNQGRTKPAKPATLAALYLKNLSTVLSHCKGHGTGYLCSIAPSPDNFADQVPSIHRVSLLHEQGADLARMRRTDDHFLFRTHQQLYIYEILGMTTKDALTIFIALSTATGSPFLTSPPSFTLTSTTTPAMGAPT